MSKKYPKFNEFKESDGSWDEEKILEFIKRNNINSSERFIELNKSLYDKLYKEGILEKYVPYKLKRSKIKEIDNLFNLDGTVNLNKLKKFLKDNNINGRSRLESKCINLYRRLDSDTIDFLFPKKFIFNKSEFVDSSGNINIDVIKVFLKENNITTGGQLKKVNCTLYNNLRKRNLLPELGITQWSPRRPRLDELNIIKSLETDNRLDISKIKDYVSNNNLSSKRQLREFNGTLYRRLEKENKLKDIFSYSGRISGAVNFNNKEGKLDVDLVKDYLIKNKISSPGILKQNFRPLYTKLKSEHLLKEVFPNHTQSSWEIRFKNELEKLQDENINFSFETQKTFDDCIYKNKLLFDFYLIVEGRKYLVEIQGPGHFFPTWGGEKQYNDTLIRDQIKRDFSKSRGIELIYLCLDETIIPKNYQYKIYLRIDDVLKYMNLL